MAFYIYSLSVLFAKPVVGCSIEVEGREGSVKTVSPPIIDLVSG